MSSASTEIDPVVLSYIVISAPMFYSSLLLFVSHNLFIFSGRIHKIKTPAFYDFRKDEIVSPVMLQYASMACNLLHQYLIPLPLCRQLKVGI